MLSLRNKILTTAAAAGLLSVGVSSAAMAQDSYMPPQGQGQQQYQQQAPDSFGEQQQQYDVSEEQLETFVEAESAARQVQSQFQGQAANITSPEEMAALQEQANDQMVQAIEESGISVEQYNMVLAAIQSDPQVRQKYIDMVQ